MASSSKHLKQKPLEVAAEAKKYYIPKLKGEYGDRFTFCSRLFAQPINQIPVAKATNTGRPSFYVCVSDPVDFAIEWARGNPALTNKVAFICPANDKRVGGDWETGVSGCEERLCRRSTLSVTLSTPADGQGTNYPIPTEGVILSPEVVVFRGPHDQYARLDESNWSTLPVVSVPPQRWPKLTQHGDKYSFTAERDIARNKIRGALRVCVAFGYDHVVVGDFGLGNSYRNPPAALAELWRDVLLYDPDLRGHFREVAFVFDDVHLSTTKLIQENISKKSSKLGAGGGGGGGGHSSSSKIKSSKNSSKSSSKASSSSLADAYETDINIFGHIFDPNEIESFVRARDPRCEISNIAS